MAAGLALIVAPGVVAIIAPAMVTPRGLLLVAAERIAIGLLMLRVAAGSRAPRVVQVLGVIVLINVLVVMLGGCIAYFVSARRPIES